jgi:hypothetical protein
MFSFLVMMLIFTETYGPDFVNAKDRMSLRTVPIYCVRVSFIFNCRRFVDWLLRSVCTKYVIIIVGLL